MNKLQAMEIFVEVVRQGSLTGAAKSLQCPVSRISRHLSWLEETLGSELIKRSTRSFTLSEVGSVYLEQCEQALSQIQLADTVVKEYQTKPSGTLRISCMASYAERRLIPLLDGFSHQYPDIRIDLEVSDRVISLVKADLDLAIRGGRMPDERIQAKFLCDNTPKLYASRAYLETFGEPQTLADLNRHKLLFFRAPSQILSWGTVTDGEWHPLNLHPHLVTNNGQLIHKAVTEGQIMALLPDWAVQAEVEIGNLINVPLPVSVTRDRLGIFLLYYKPRYQIPKIRAAVDYFSTHLCNE